MSDSNGNIVIYNTQLLLQGMTNNVGYSDGYMGSLQLVLSKTNEIGDTRCNI